METNGVLLQVRDLKKYFPIQQGLFRKEVAAVRAVDGLSFDLRQGETLALVGDKGSGKSTTGRTILQLIRPTSGRVTFNGQDLTKMGESQLRPLRRQMQILFHDPYTALNPRLTVQKLLEEPLTIHGNPSGSERKKRVDELLGLVGLNPYLAGRHPHEFSGGQRQRINVARALATNPSLLVADEPVASLDPVIQNQVIELLHRLKQELGLTILLLAPDLSQVRAISDRVALLIHGRIVELAQHDDLFDRPLHPYSQVMLSAVPLADPTQELRRKQLQLDGTAATIAQIPAGCRFHPRCPYTTDLCRQTDPPLRDLGTVAKPHWVACHYAERFQLLTPEGVSHLQPGNSIAWQPATWRD